MKRIVALLLLTMLLSGCGIIRLRQKETPNALPSRGMFWTANSGEGWVLRSSLYSTTSQIPSVSFNTISKAVLDPSDSNTIYLATDSGLYYTFSRGEGWFQTLTGQGVVNDVAVDPTDKCTIYAAVHNKIFKSTDCARSWTVVHFSSLSGEFFRSIMVSYRNPSVIFVGASTGTLLESEDAGRSWEVKSFYDSEITKLIPNPHDPEVFYLVTPRYGIQRTVDHGTTWTDLNELPVYDTAGVPIFEDDEAQVLRQLPGAKTFFDLKFDASQEEGLIYASGYGIFRLIGGAYWQVIDVLNRPQKQKIYTIDIDSETGQTIYFATQGAIYRSSNGGVEWTVLPAPSTGIPRALILFPEGSAEFIAAFIPPPE